MLNLYDVLSVVGRETVTQVEVEKLQASFQGENIIVTCGQPFEVTLKQIEKEVVSVSFETKVEVSRSCSRCLEEVNCEYQLSVFRNINVASKEAYIDDASEADEISYIEDCTLDVDMLVLDELYTMIPMNVLCKEDCKGICKKCGKDLNLGDCGCDDFVPDPRMAVIKDIFNANKEV